MGGEGFFLFLFSVFFFSSFFVEEERGNLAMALRISSSFLSLSILPRGGMYLTGVGAGEGRFRIEGFECGK